MIGSEVSVDLLVIGWGKARKTLAKRYALVGRSVTLVERDPVMYGGTCFNVACVPTKDLVLQSCLWGVSAGPVVVSFRGLLVSASPA